MNETIESFKIKQKVKQNFHAGRILFLIALAFVFENTYPFVAILLAVTGVLITFTKISNCIKQEKEWEK